MYFPELFSRDSTGKIRMWYMQTEGDKYRTTSGTVDGAKTTSEWTVCEPKNVGRSNMTTGEEQADAEVRAEYTKKLKTGYFRDIDDVDKGTQVFPMLAQKFKDLKKPLPFGKSGIFSQPKLDGIRCLARDTGNFSRTAEPILTYPDITEVMESLYGAHLESVILDGELYSHEFHDDLPKINSLVRKKVPTEEDFEEAKKLQYHVYDVIIPKHPDMPFSERSRYLAYLFEDVLNDHPRFALVPTVKHSTQDELDSQYKHYVQNNFEGQIIRLDEPYETDKRSKSLLKRKEYIDAEFPLVDILPGKGNWANAAKSAVYLAPNGETFSTGIAGTFEANAKILAEKDRYIGGEGTVTYFKFSPYGIPIQGVTKAFYEGKRDV